MRRASLLASVCLAGTALSMLGAACSDGGHVDTVAADKWVTSVCDAAHTYKAKTDKLGDQIAQLDFAKDAKNAQATFVDLLTQGRKAQDDAVKAVSAAGLPDLKSGKDLKVALDDNLKANQQTLDGLIAKVKALDPKASDFADKVNQASNTPDHLLLPEWQKIAASQPDAQQVIDKVQADADCASVVFSGSDNAAANPSATSTAKASATAKASTTAKVSSTSSTASSKNEKWVSGLCTAVTGFANDMQDLGNNFEPDSNDPQDVKNALVEFLGQARDRANTLKSDINKLGDPDIKDGSKVESEMVSAAGGVVTLFQQSLNDAKNLDTSNEAQMVQDVQQLGQNIQDASTGIEDSFAKIDQKYDTSEITKIGQSLPECADLFP